jgi:PAS domain S-box-containing protein
MRFDGDITAQPAADGTETAVRKVLAFGVFIALLGALFWIGWEEDGYLLFHVLSEMFRISVAVAIFLMAWNTRRYCQAGFVLTLGVGLLFVGGVDLVHTLSYKGMGIFEASKGANLATQLWMAGRFLDAPTLLLAMLIPRCRLSATGLLAGYAAVTALLLLSIFQWHIFPTCFVDGTGPGAGITLFKQVGEWAIMAVMAASLGLLVWHRRQFDRPVFLWLAGSIVCTIMAEEAFTLYSYNVYGPINQLGHILKLIAFFCIYKALVETGLRRPYDLLFRDLRASRERLAKSRDELEVRVKERTAELRGAVDTLMAEVRDRLAAEQMLKISEERFRLIAETIQDVVWISTPGMAKMLYVSPAYENIWGRSCQSLYDHPESFVEAVLPEDRGRMIPGLHHPSDGQWDFEYRIVRPDATVLWVRDRGYPIRDAQGNLTGMAGTATDITARKLRDANLAESEARLAKAQEVAHLGNWEWDIPSNELWWSDQIYRIFGIAPNEFEATYDAFLSFVHPDDRSEVESAVKEALAGTARYSIDHRILRLDGQQRVVHESGEVIRDAEGKPTRMSGTVQDITRRKQVEAELQESEQRYRELVELSPIGIIVSVEGEIVFINPAGASILGAARPAELVGRKVDDLTHADYALMFRDRLRRAQEMRVELPLVEMQMSKADGTLVMVESASAFVMYERKPAVQTVFRDVTERHRQAGMIERERQRLFAVLNMLPGYVSIVGPDYSVRFANHRYLEAFGEPGGRQCHFIQCGRDVPCEVCPLPRVFNENRSQEYEWSTPQGRTYRVWAYPFADMDGSLVALTIGLDVTERKALEREVIDASEIERRSIGRDLHDSLGQELTGLSLLMESLIKGLAEQAPQKAALGRQILNLVRQSVSQVRAMSKGLDPVNFSGGGLASGLRDLAEGIHKQSGIECSLRCHDGVSIQNEAVATHLYRIAQEAVNNAVKHAEADHIEIGLAQDDAGIRLTISDDGKGLPGGPDEADNGMGMRTMRYRASVSGGMLNIAAGENGGTKITCFIPAVPNSSRGDRNTWAPRRM